MISALFDDCLKALGQLRDPSTIGLLLLTAAIALGVLVGVTAATGWLLSDLAITGYGWLDMGLQWAGTAAAGVVSWFIYPIVVSAILGLFSDRLCDLVERRHYPELPPATGLSFADAVIDSATFLGKALILNLFVLPLYLLPGPNLAIYLGLNGYLVGREYFDAVGHRRKGRSEQRQLRRHLRFEVWFAGIVIAALLLVPVVNLFVPMLGFALMVHQYQRFSQPPEFNY